MASIFPTPSACLTGCPTYKAERMPDWLPHIQILNGNLPARRINQRSGWKTFIHDDKVKGIQLAGLVVHALNSGDNDLLRGVAAPESGGIDADLQLRTERFESRRQ